MLRTLVLPRRGFFSCVAAMLQYLEFASSQWNRPVASHVFRRGPGGFPHSRSDPGPEKVMKPRIISLRRGFFISPVVTGASASVGSRRISSCHSFFRLPLLPRLRRALIVVCPAEFLSLSSLCVT